MATVQTKISRRADSSTTRGARRQLAAEGWEISPEDLAVLSPYQTMRINRFGVYATDEITVTPEQYDAHLPDIDLTVREPVS